MWKEEAVFKESGQRTAKGGFGETTLQESTLTTRHLEFAVFYPPSTIIMPDQGLKKVSANAHQLLGNILFKMTPRLSQVNDSRLEAQKQGNP